MRKTLRVLVAVLSILVAALAIFSLFFRIGELKTSGERSSGAEYSILRNELMALQTKDNLRDQLVRDKLIALYRGSKRLLAAQVLDANGFVAWKLPADSAYFALPNVSSARSGFKAPESSTVVFTTTLNDGMRLSALYASIRRSDIAQAAKVPLMVVAIWCLVVALAFLLFGEERKDSLLPDAIDTSKIDLNAYAPKSELEAEDEALEPELASDAEGEAGNTADAAEIEEEHAPAPAAPETAEPRIDAAAATSAAAAPSAAAAAQPAAPQAQPKPDAPAQSVADAARSGRSFEESLAKLEEEIVEWTNRHSERAAKDASEKTPANAAPATPATEPAAPADADQELDEEIDELEATPEEEAAGGEDMTLADSMETLEEFEELNADGEERPEAEGAQARESAPADLPRAQAAPAREPAAQPQERQDLATFPMPLSLSDSQVEARLNEELGRNIRTDVSLMLIHCGVSSRSDPAAVALAVTIKDYIGSKDLIFELYKGAFAVVLPSVDLGGALKMSEDLADVLSATLSLYRDIEGEAPVYIGISARSDRKVDAYKIYREASTAVHKAYSGSHSRILAFRPKAE
ncbi:hypothetical protein LWX53_07020 [bacterium]|nr:hypothetical protein [bacterium]